MGNDAGFAAAVTIHQQVLHNDLIATYANGQFPSTLNHSLPGGPPDASVSFFIGEPDITCEGTTNLLVITVPVWGGVTVTATDPVTVQVKGTIEITIVPDFQLITEADKPSYAQLNSLTTIAVRTWTATVTSADPPADVASYVISDVFRMRLQAAIIQAVVFGIISLPQIPLDYLHGIPGFVAKTGIASVVVDGALLLGFNVNSSDSPIGAFLGDVMALTDFAGSFDLAAFVNPRAVQLFFSEVATFLAKAAASNGATFDASALSMTCADGHAHVTGKFEKSGATVNFSFDVIANFANYSTAGAQWVGYTLEHWVDNPRLRTVKPRSWPALWFTTGNAQSDVDKGWLLDLLEAGIAIVTLGLGLFVYLPIFSEIGNAVNEKINDHPPSAPYPRVQRTVAPAGGIVLRTALDGFDLNANGITVGVHVSAKPTAIAVTGPAIIPNGYAAEMLHYTLHLPSGALSSDPTLRVAWTLTDAASGAMLAPVQDDAVNGALPVFEFQPSLFASTTDFHIQGRLYRLFGTDVTDVGSAMTSLHVRGALAPEAYVCWRAQSVKPQVVFDTISGEWTYGGDAHVQRRSKWHRTDAPCQAASKGGHYAGRYQPQYANTLPFSITALDQFRPLLCDYCFFGGPAGRNGRF